ncbi:rhomboid family intramembrane serine protease [Acidiluteibacter ferrifornacis]|uniref:Rhomboid family intramembrane serine protease n=1 Tax=Acidiluteibacter ferrifornacis TaxID=2692424 RepID=A0A6N9NHN0_9FLAO|nr:rhomboid family intramembrane serine protease [Acidiluteibacter ferrifornacis]NBG65413.1 rhomboid family intramembrane serine protease [Acidiluteibacter ferrifornacis]
MSITLIIILATGIVSAIAFKNRELFQKLEFTPYVVFHQKEYFRFFTHALLHADWMHLLINMLVLWFFGETTEYYFQAYLGAKGIFYFILLYVGSVIFASLPTFNKHKENYTYRSVGASGAVSAIVMSSVIFNPLNSICLYGLICFPGIIWAIIYLVYSFQMAKKSSDNINHDAHFWGAVFGIVFTIVAIPSTLMNFINQLLSVFS